MLAKDPVPGVSAKPKEDNLRYFSVRIEGPPDTPFAGGAFALELFLCEDYPMVPPVRCASRVAVSARGSSAAPRRRAAPRRAPTPSSRARPPAAAEGALPDKNLPPQH